jgi:hypothetical protein
MRTSDNGLLEVKICKNIDSILVGEDPSVKLPVKESKAEFGWHLALKGSEGVKDEGVRGGGGSYFSGEGSVNEVDKERWGE